MQSEEIRRRFLAFFEKRGHAIIPSASLVPQDDPSVLFTTAGMQPLVPYLLGEKHPAGTRLANVQKCVRTQDIEEVGDKTHDTFFEMLGNWSLGDPDAPDGIGAGYFKEDTIKWSYEFLTNGDDKPEGDKGLGLDPKRLYITCFEGDEDAPRDEESATIWKKAGIPENRIYFFGKKSNWWSPGDNGPSGPDTEMFYDITETGLGDLTKEEFLAADERQDIIEIWNDVFMEYEKKDGKVVGKLKQKNVDTGAGLERLAMVLQKKDNIFETDLFENLLKEINKFSAVDDIKAKRILADHIRTTIFIVADGVNPAKTDRGYILRRLIRRAARNARILKISLDSKLVDLVIAKYSSIYPSLSLEAARIKELVMEEKYSWDRALANAIKFIIPLLERFENGAPIPKLKVLDGKELFKWSSTYGISLEELLELIDEVRLEDGFTKFTPERIEKFIKDFNAETKIHQELSRTGAEKKFKGGLAGHSEKEVQYHTATHLLHQALRTVLGEHVYQKGSNITPERLRFDFIHPQKMTDAEKKAVEDLVNQKIKEALPVSFEELPLDEARERGAIGLFDDQYGERVKVYKVGDEKTGIFSFEFCGGPHVSNTADLRGTFRIQKEEAVSVGVRRIKAILE
ncbi:MAG TPA: alanine--tRNA ligase [Candidatus Paceibacterota bacterium]